MKLWKFKFTKFACVFYMGFSFQTSSKEYFSFFRSNKVCSAGKENVFRVISFFFFLINMNVQRSSTSETEIPRSKDFFLECMFKHRIVLWCKCGVCLVFFLFCLFGMVLVCFFVLVKLFYHCWLLFVKKNILLFYFE